MATAQKLENYINLNLIPQESVDKRLGGRILVWVLSYGRYIIVLTNFIVILVFLSRFVLDRKISDLYEEIDEKQAVVEANLAFIKDFRLVNDKINLASTLYPRTLYHNKILEFLPGATPENLFVSELEFTPTQLTLSGTVENEAGLSTLISELRASNNFQTIDLSSLTQKTEKHAGLKFQLLLKNKPDSWLKND